MLPTGGVYKQLVLAVIATGVVVCDNVQLCADIAPAPGVNLVVP
jgi:hypothetical protein